MLAMRSPTTDVRSIWRHQAFNKRKSTIWARRSVRPSVHSKAPVENSARAIDLKGHALMECNAVRDGEKRKSNSPENGNYRR